MDLMLRSLFGVLRFDKRSALSLAEQLRTHSCRSNRSWQTRTRRWGLRHDPASHVAV